MFQSKIHRNALAVGRESPGIHIAVASRLHCDATVAFPLHCVGHSVATAVEMR
jgi:hypothetical protein